MIFFSKLTNYSQMNEKVKAPGGVKVWIKSYLFIWLDLITYYIKVLQFYLMQILLRPQISVYTMQLIQRIRVKN